MHTNPVLAPKATATLWMWRSAAQPHCTSTGLLWAAVCCQPALRARTHRPVQAHVQRAGLWARPDVCALGCADSVLHPLCRSQELCLVCVPILGACVRSLLPFSPPGRSMGAWCMACHAGVPLAVAYDIHAWWWCVCWWCVCWWGEVRLLQIIPAERLGGSWPAPPAPCHELYDAWLSFRALHQLHQLRPARCLVAASLPFRQAGRQAAALWQSIHQRRAGGQAGKQAGVAAAAPGGCSAAVACSASRAC